MSEDKTICLFVCRYNALVHGIIKVNIFKLALSPRTICFDKYQLKISYNLNDREAAK